jgi:mRNA-degrading endonuclease toxin of MazEF toxin-antitoxin module
VAIGGSVVRRGLLARYHDSWFVVVSADTLNRLLPTCWALLADPQPPQLQPPLVQLLPANTAGDHPDLWVRCTQIRTVAVDSLEPIGPLPARHLSHIDAVLARIVDIQP